METTSFTRSIGGRPDFDRAQLETQSKIGWPRSRESSTGSGLTAMGVYAGTADPKRLERYRGSSAKSRKEGMKPCCRRKANGAEYAVMAD